MLHSMTKPCPHLEIKAYPKTAGVIVHGKFYAILISGRRPVAMYRI